MLQAVSPNKIIRQVPESSYSFQNIFLLLAPELNV